MILLKKLSNIFKIKNRLGLLEPFYPNQAQKRLLNLVEYQKQNPSKNGMRKKGQVRINIPKARQLGLSTLIKILEMSCAIENPGWETFTIADKEDSANKIFSKIKLAFRNLPKDLLDIYKFQIINDNLSNLKFQVGDDEPVTLSTATSARSGTYQFLHISELGKMSMIQEKWNETFEGTKPAVENAEYVFYESTCDGGLGKYYNFTQSTERGETPFDNLFLPWYLEKSYSKKAPENDEWLKDYESLVANLSLEPKPLEKFEIDKNQMFWYYSKVREMMSEGVAEGIKSQYPFTLEEAFVSKSLSKFNISKVKGIIPRNPLEITQGVKQFRNISGGLFYSIGVDTSGGKEDGDFTGITVREMSNSYPLTFQFKGRINPDLTILLIFEIFSKILSNGGYPIITVEAVDNTGGVVNQGLRHLIGEDTYFYQRFDTDPNRLYGQNRGDIGFKTTGSSRNEMIAKFSALFDNNQIEITNIDEIREMLAFCWNESKKKYEHLDGEHDDLLMSDFICLMGFDFIMKYRV